MKNFGRLAAVILAMIALLPASALAAKKTLFLLDNFRQQLDFLYEYNGIEVEVEDREGSYSRQHRFEEKYRFDIDYAVLSPSLWRGRIAFDAGLDQQQRSFSGGREGGNDSGTGFGHYISGTLFERKSHPMTFFSRSDVTHATREFGESYDIQTDGFGMGLNSRNTIIPFRLNYSSTTTTTEGLNRDQVRTSEEIQLDASHLYRSLSRTDLTLRRSDYRTKLSGGEEHDLDYTDVIIANALQWSSGGRGRTLHSRFNLRSGSETENRTWMEGLDWHFGAGLRGGMEYTNTSQETRVETIDTDSGHLFLRHQFMRNLTTQVDLDVDQISRDLGEEESTFGALSVAYTRNLPDRGNLLLQLSQRYGVVDRRYTLTQVPAIDEPHTAVLLGQMTLDNLNVLPESVVVRHSDPAVRNIAYVRDLDYRLDQVGLQTVITVLPGSDIADGDPLVISYLYRSDLEIKYAQTTRRLAGSLSFRENYYRFFGAIEQSEQELISGSEEVLGLSDSRSFNLGFESLRGFYSFGGEYKNSETDYDSRQSVEGFARLSHKLSRIFLSLGLSDRYAMIEPARGASSGYNQNTVGLAATCRLPMANGSVELTSSYYNTQGEVINRDDLSFGLNYQVGFGGYLLSLLAKTNWRMTAEDSIRDDNVRLQLTRFF